MRLFFFFFLLSKHKLIKFLPDKKVPVVAVWELLNAQRLFKKKKIFLPRRQMCNHMIFSPPAMLKMHFYFFKHTPIKEGTSVLSPSL